MTTPVYKSPMEDPAGYLARQSGKKILAWAIIPTIIIVLFFTALFNRVGFFVDYHGIAIKSDTKEYAPYTYSKLVDFGRQPRLPSPGNGWNVYAGRYILGDLGSSYETFSTPYGTCDGSRVDACGKAWGLSSTEVPKNFRTKIMTGQIIVLVIGILFIVAVFILLARMRKRLGKESGSA